MEHSSRQLRQLQLHHQALKLPSLPFCFDVSGSQRVSLHFWGDGRELSSIVESPRQLKLGKFESPQVGVSVGQTSLG
jgi:hypothetical protein